MPDPIKFGLFDKTAEVDISLGRLPHWFQAGVATFITFRTADSLPKEVLRRWEREQADWLARAIKRMGETKPENASFSATAFGETSSLKVPPALHREFQRSRWQAWHARLDECHGACLLRRPDLATIVADSVRCFDGERYHLDCLVVMPNHIHLLVQFSAGVELRKQCGEWQRYSAGKMNKVLGRRGPFWQREPFDHLVRTAEQFGYLRRYIAENPLRAGLSPGNYLYWARDEADGLGDSATQG